MENKPHIYVLYLNDVLLKTLSKRHCLLATFKN